MLCGEIHTQLSMTSYLLTRSLTAFFMRPCGCFLRYDCQWWIISIVRYQTHDYRQAINIPKLSEEDTTLTVGNAAGEKLTIPVQKGVRIIIDTPGLHYNRERIYRFGNVYFWLIFTFFFLCSSLLERSLFLQTCTILRRLAEGCVHTVQRWLVLAREFFQSVTLFTGSLGPRACLGRK